MFRTKVLKLLSLCSACIMLAVSGCASKISSEIGNTTSSKTTPEITPSPEPAEAGTNSGIIRDGTPKKYFTLSFDDGITQDLKIIEILKKYNVHCCTFNINTGLYGANWEWVGQVLNNPDLVHQRFTEEELRQGIYNGYDVEVHTLSHASLKTFDKDPDAIKREVGLDAENITSITGIIPVGMAWPGGDTEYTSKTIELVLENTNIHFARGTTATQNFRLPKYFMKWQPTCAISDENCISLAERFLKTECTKDMLFYVWGHGYELDHYNSYDKLESLIKMMSEAEDVVLVTNAEFYQLFKDEIPSWK